MTTIVGNSNKTHYARLGHATQNIIPKFLQELLLFLEKPEDIEIKCQKNPHFYSKLKMIEKRKIRAVASNGTYEGFDIPLIYTILRNLHDPAFRPSSGWDHPNDPQPNQLTLGDDVERCRRTRNKIIHRGNTSVSDAELEEYFNLFRGIAQRFENALKKQTDEFVRLIDDLKTCCMDENTERKYLREIDQLKQEMAFQTEAIKSLEEKDKEKEIKILKLQEKMMEGYDEDEASEVMKHLDDTTCVEGTTASLECTVAGAKYVAKWFKDGNEIVYDRRSRQEVKLSNEMDGSKIYIYTLTVLKVTHDDTGTYKLQLGNKTYECSLSVTAKTPSLITLRSYQEELAEVAITGRNTIICSGTNAGKTYVAYHIIEDHFIKKPQGKVVFINKTNVLLQQQYERACSIFKDLFFQEKIYKWDASREGECEPFSHIVERVSLFFCTPKSLCNHLDEKCKTRVFLDQFTLIILDECHHVMGRNPFNEIMSYYRRHKFEEVSKSTPQIVGLTASPGTNKSDSTHAAMEHLKSLMTKMDVSKLSVVRKHEEELLKYSSTPTKVRLVSEKRPNDPITNILLNAVRVLEGFFDNSKVTNFLMEPGVNGLDLFNMLRSPPITKTEDRYLQWVSLTKQQIESLMLKNSDIPRILHMCIRNIELYVDCLEMNSLLEVDHVVDLLFDGFSKFSFEIQQTETVLEKSIVDVLKGALSNILEKRRTVEGNPDVHEIIKTLTTEYEKLREDARFLIFVKTRTSAQALARRLPEFLKATHLTGNTKSTDKAGLPVERQLETMERFRDGEHLCIVATSVACEGLDIPQCNLMIRYKFRVNEINSYQMRGRIRNKEGKEVILAPMQEFVIEDRNIQRQYYMKKAIEQVIGLDLDETIALAEKSLFMSEDRERVLQQLRSDQTRKGEFLIHCKICGRRISDGIYFRHIKKKQYIIYDPSILKTVSLKPAERIKSFDAMKKTAAVTGPCRHSWGVIIQYEKCCFVTISKDKVSFFYKISKERIKFKKWTEFPFYIDELSDQEIQDYLSAQTNDPELETIIDKISNKPQ